VLFTPEDDSDLADKLVELLVDEERRSRLAKQGQHAVLTRFSVGPMADRAVEIYMESSERLRKDPDKA
jgi:glycosyltransferase involved in cell wall biosynthesis